MLIQVSVMARVSRLPSETVTDSVTALGLVMALELVFLLVRLPGTKYSGL